MPSSVAVSPSPDRDIEAAGATAKEMIARVLRSAEVSEIDR